MPRDPAARAMCEEIISQTVAEEGLVFLGWRDVPVDNSDLGRAVLATEPVHRQLFVGRPDDITDEDEQAVYGEAVKVVVDPASAQLLLGATLDYKDGLNQAGFNITNPNATRSCGCGQSFS